MKQITRFFCFVLISCFFFTPVFAYRTIDSSGTLLASTTEPTGLSTADIQTTTGTFIKASLALVGTVFLGLMVYGGFLWMTARGAEDQIAKSKETIVAALIGIAVILSAYAITNMITSSLLKNKPSAASLGNALQECAAQLTTCKDQCRGTADQIDRCERVCITANVTCGL